MSRTTAKTSPASLPGGLPFLGHAWRFRRDPVGLLQHGRDQFGEIFSFPLFGKRVHVLTGPEANEAFFRAPDDQLSAKEAYQFTVPVFGKGIAYDVEPQLMDEQLGFLFPALRESRLQTYAHIMAAEAEAYFKAWGECGEVDLLKVMNELTLFVASRCLIGAEFRQQLTTEFARLYHDLEGGINFIAFMYPYLPTPAHRRRDLARARMVELISKIIAERRAKQISGDDFLQTLMDARYADGRALSDDNIVGLLLTVIFAGQHTSAVLAAWTGILLLENQKFLPAILEEQQAVFSAGQAMSLPALRELAALERTIKEAERLRPPLIMLMRAILRDFEFKGCRMPRGDLAMISPAVSHRVPEVFRNPDQYDPTRFAPGREEDKQAHYCLIGFGGGKHRCIGLHFAYQQIKVIWSVLLGQFELDLAQSKYEPNYATFVVGPKQPCPIRYRRRRQALSPLRVERAASLLEPSSQ